jgi:glycosyltransferase involved in cell wall biosynthesis
LTSLIAIISPMHNEAGNVAGIGSALDQQTFRNFDWYVVDDGSEDGTDTALAQLKARNAPMILPKANDGGLIGGSAFSSWRAGVSKALESGRPYTHFMKLDADVRLEPDYLEKVLVLAEQPEVGLSGGVITSIGMVEQAFHIPGPVKLYSRRALDIVLTLPSAIGFDIMDEMILARNGLVTRVDKTAGFELARETGSSEGIVHGRVRHGRGCRWTGYSFPYFLIRCLRYFLRRPYVVGPFAMLWGYLTAGSGPYDADLKRRHAKMQRAKLRRALVNPWRFYREAYSR